MMHELLIGLLKANLAASTAIVVILAARRAVRSVFGAELAYSLWLLVPFAMAASLAPPRPAGFPPATPVAPAPLVRAAEQKVLAVWEQTAPAAGNGIGFDPTLIVTLVWMAGLLGMAAWLALKQREFMKDLAEGHAGPAVVGVLSPRIVLPADFEQRFDADERAVVLAHEEAHLVRQDARINAITALFRCICWFNPFVHAAAYLLRIDQELACDATVIKRHPKARGHYAQALLKAQLAARPLPLGCYWPAGTEHPLMERMGMLERPTPTRARRLAGAALIGVLSAGAGYATWTSAPAAAAPIAYIEKVMTPPTAVAKPHPAAGAAERPDSGAAGRDRASAPPVGHTVISLQRFEVRELEFGQVVRIASGSDPKVADVRMADLTRARIVGGWYGRTQVQFHGADGRLVMTADIQVGDSERVPYVGLAAVPFGQAFERYFDPASPLTVTGRVIDVRLTGDARSELIVEQDVGGGKGRFRVSVPDPIYLTPDWKAGLKMLPGSVVQVRGYQAYDRTCEGGGCLMNGMIILTPPPVGGGGAWPPVTATNRLEQP